MAVYEITSQMMDFLFKRATQTFSGAQATQAFMADVYFYANLVAVVVQLFLVSLIMRKLGLTVALLVLPAAVLISSFLYLAVPVLMVASLLVISDNGLNYSIQQTARETLYVPTTPDEKYKARAFTNMFVQRFAKGLSIFLVIGVIHAGISVRLIAVTTVLLAVGMALLGIFCGRRFAVLTGDRP
jgi:AAA family ATP:ADP antiporter